MMPSSLSRTDFCLEPITFHPSPLSIYHNYLKTIFRVLCPLFPSFQIIFKFWISLPYEKVMAILLRLGLTVTTPDHLLSFPKMLVKHPKKENNPLLFPRHGYHAINLFNYSFMTLSNLFLNWHPLSPLSLNPQHSNLAKRYQFWFQNGVTRNINCPL
jgi:hypothetical protein